MTRIRAIHRHGPRARRAFTLLHIVHAMALLGLFLLLASQLFARTWGLIQQTSRQQEQVFLATEVTQRLRRDVWQADRITVPEAHRAILHHGQQRIIWRAGEEGHLRREVEAVTRDRAAADDATPAGSPARAFNLGATLRFAASEAGLRVRDEQHELVMVSQTQLWRAGHTR